MSKRFLHIAVAAGSLALTTARADELQQNWKLLETYCVKCHNATDWAGGIAYDTMQPETAAEDAEIWEKAVRKLRGTLMPPPGKPQPDPAARQAFISTMETFLDRSAVQQAESGIGRSASSQPHGVRERHPRPARPRHRSDGAAAAG